ncbi:MAG: permease-like cell division protein FtsX [Lachnospiraceae bacterium]|nr:permease-like cell division protein FtsX [Lachnospiraceae bacterium]
MKISTLGYSIKQGLKNIRRNLLFSLASVGTMVACLFLFGVFYSIVLNMEHEIDDIQNSLVVSVFFNEGYNDEQIMQVGNEIKKLENINSVNYISADVAWNGYVEDVYQGDAEYVESVFGDDNPLENSSSYEITLKDISRQDITVKQLEAITGVRKVNSSKETAQGWIDVSTLVGYVSLGIILILLFVSLFLISNTITIGIAVRKEEIAIMKLIGAKDIFVRAPFLFEGVFIGLLGSLIPLVIMYFVYNAMTGYLTQHFALVSNMIEFVPVGEVFKWMAPCSVLIGVGVGFFGSLITTHKHLKV